MKIGFCFLTKDNIHFENLWKAFFDSVDVDNYSIYIHSKTPNVESIFKNACIDLNPIETSWGSISLVHATKRLLETAFDDECESVVFLSGDSLPLWNFRTIRYFCSETLFSLQPKDGLYPYQIEMNRREHMRIRDYYQLSTSANLVKQNMFFSISKADFDTVKGVDIHSFPSQEVPDEYFWANQLIIGGKSVDDSKYIFVNNDPTKTQALSYVLDGEIISNVRSKGYLFIRKIASFLDNQTMQYLAKIIS